MVKEAWWYNQNTLLKVCVVFSIFMAIVVKGFLFLHFSIDMYNANSSWLEICYHHSVAKPYIRSAKYPPMDYSFLYALLLKGLSAVAMWSNNFDKLYETIILKVMHIALSEPLAMYFIYKIVRIRHDKTIAWLAALLVLWCPVTLLNNAWWGQTDLIVSACLLGTFYSFLQSRYKTGTLFIGLAYGIKLTCIYILPPVILYMYIRKVPFRYLLVGVGFFFALALLFWILGLPLIQVLKTIGRQYVTYDEAISFGLPNLANVLQETMFYDINKNTHLVFNDASLVRAMFRFMLIGISIMSCIITFLVIIHRFAKNKLTIPYPDFFLRLIIFFSVLLPYLMPKQHERYWTPIAQIFILLYPFFNFKRTWLAILFTLVNLHIYIVCSSGPSNINATIYSLYSWN